jgi:hypothetical protein
MRKAIAALAVVGVLASSSGVGVAQTKKEDGLLRHYLLADYTVVGYTYDATNFRHSVLLFQKNLENKLDSLVSCQLEGIAGKVVRTVGCVRVD